MRLALANIPGRFRGLGAVGVGEVLLFEGDGWRKAPQKRLLAFLRCASGSSRRFIGRSDDGAGKTDAFESRKP